MNHIIDGHNLIAKVPGLALDMPDDEQRLVDLLVAYCKRGSHRVEVYFDGAPPGQAGVRNHGLVRAHFVSHTSTADDAIRSRLRSLGRAAKNWLVVSSDRSVQAAGREGHAQVLSAEDFALRLLASTQARSASSSPSADEPLSEAEVREWEAIFKKKPKQP